MKTFPNEINNQCSSLNLTQNKKTSNSFPPKMSKFIAHALNFVPAKPYSTIDRQLQQKLKPSEFYNPTTFLVNTDTTSEEIIEELFVQASSFEQYVLYLKMSQLRKCASDHRNKIFTAPTVLLVSLSFFRAITPWSVVKSDHQEIEQRLLKFFLDNSETFKFTNRIFIGPSSGRLPERQIAASTTSTPLTRTLNLLRPQLQFVKSSFQQNNSFCIIDLVQLQHLEVVHDLEQTSVSGKSMAKELLLAFASSNNNNNIRPQVLSSLVLHTARLWSSCWDRDAQLVMFSELTPMFVELRRNRIIQNVQANLLGAVKENPDLIESFGESMNLLLKADFDASQFVKYLDSELEEEIESDDDGDLDDEESDQDDLIFESADRRFTVYNNKPILSLVRKMKTPITVLNPTLDFYSTFIENGDFHRLTHRAQLNVASFFSAVATFAIHRLSYHNANHFMNGDNYNFKSVLPKMFRSLWRQFESAENPSVDLFSAVSEAFRLYGMFIRDSLWGIPTSGDDDAETSNQCSARDERVILTVMHDKGRKILEHFPFEELTLFLDRLGNEIAQSIEKYKLHRNLCSKMMNLCERVSSYLAEEAVSSILDREIEIFKFKPLFIEHHFHLKFIKFLTKIPVLVKEGNLFFVAALNQVVEAVSELTGVDRPVRKALQAELTKKCNFRLLVENCGRVGRALRHEVANSNNIESAEENEREVLLDLLRQFHAKVLREFAQKDSAKEKFALEDAAAQMQYTETCASYFLQLTQLERATARFLNHLRATTGVTSAYSTISGLLEIPSEVSEDLSATAAVLEEFKNLNRECKIVLDNANALKDKHNKFNTRLQHLRFDRPVPFILPSEAQKHQQQQGRRRLRESGSDRSETSKTRPSSFSNRTSKPAAAAPKPKKATPKPKKAVPKKKKQTKRKVAKKEVKKKKTAAKPKSKPKAKKPAPKKKTTTAKKNK